MKILLCQPPVEDFYTTPDRHYPLGLLSLAGFIQDLPVTCKVVDFLHTGNRRTIPLPKNFTRIRKLLNRTDTPVKTFGQYYHFGMDWDKMEAFFREESPDLIGVSSNFYTYSYEAIQTIRLARKACPKAYIVVGGQNVRDGLFTLGEDIPVDFAIAGEGEIPFRKMVEALLHKPDIQVRDYQTGECICTPVEKIRVAHDLVRASNYTIGGYPMAMVQTSRGCPYRCGFCTIERTFGRTMRYRPVGAVLKEIEGLVHRGVKVLDFEDDNLTVDRDFAVSLFEGIRNRYGDSLRLYAMNGLSSWTLDRDLLTLMRQAGFVMLNLSVGTLSEESLRKSKRVDSREDFARAANIAHNLGMKVMGYFIAGLPGEGYKDGLETLRFLQHLPLVPGISPFYYIPGQTLRIPHIPTNPRDARLTRFYPSHEGITEEELVTLFQKTILENRKHLDKERDGGTFSSRRGR
jgi:radical SAM superfamily enzyme YgiQ (UPF0313 family)